MGNREDKDMIYCLKVDSGEEVWRFVYECQVKSYLGTFSTPVVDDGWVYTLSRKGDVYCLNARSGKKRWSVNITNEFGAREPKYGFSGSPVVEGDFLNLGAVFGCWQ